MTNKQFLEIEKRLLPDLPGFRVKGPLMMLAPIEHLLRSVCFERQSDKESFYVHAFVMPLCVPQRYLVFNFGKHVRNARGGNGWRASMPNLIQDLSVGLTAQAVPCLSCVRTLPDFVAMARAHSLSDFHSRRAIAFSLARAGDIESAVEEIDRLVREMNAAVQWQTDVVEMCQALRAKLIRDPDAAQAQLAAWEEETVRNLKLEEFWVRG